MAKQGSFTLVACALLAEGALLAIYGAWAYWRAVPLFPRCSLEDLFWGVLATIPLCVVNGALVFLLRRDYSCLSKTREFIDLIVSPLANNLTLGQAALIALAAGICEELFFRVTLLSEFGLLVSSLLFSVMHFGPAIREFRFLFVWYAILGSYLGVVVIFSGSIWVGIISHALYDLIALVFLRYFYSPSSETVFET